MLHRQFQVLQSSGGWVKKLKPVWDPGAYRPKTATSAVFSTFYEEERAATKTIVTLLLRTRRVSVSIALRTRSPIPAASASLSSYGRCCNRDYFFDSLFPVKSPQRV